MKTYFSILIAQIILCLVYSHTNIRDDSLRFLADGASAYTENQIRNLDSTSTSGTSLQPIRCFWLETKSGTVFDLKNLKRPFNQKSDYSIQVSPTENVAYNFCDNTLSSCSKIGQAAYFNSNGSCKTLAGDIKFANQWALINQTDPNEGVSITLNSGSPCPFGVNSAYQTTFLLRCNKNMKIGQFNLISYNFQLNQCSNTFEFQSAESCPKINFYIIWQFITKFSVIFGAVLILIGLFETFYGAKIMIVTIFLATCMATITVVFIFLFQFIIPSGGSPAIVWVVLGISTVIGMVLGYIVSKYNKAVIGMILGGHMGYILGLILYDSIFVKIESNPTVVYWCTIVFSILVCIALAYFLVEQVIIVSTSLIGSYSIIRGISLYAGGFPDETYVIDLIRNQEFDTLHQVLTPIVYAYLAGWLVIFMIGLAVQNKLRQDSDKKAELNENVRYFIQQ